MNKATIKFLTAPLSIFKSKTRIYHQHGQRLFSTHHESNRTWSGPHGRAQQLLAVHEADQSHAADEKAHEKPDRPQNVVVVGEGWEEGGEYEQKVRCELSFSL